MTVIEIGAVAVAAVFVLVVAGRLLNRANTVAPVLQEGRMPTGPVGDFVAAVNRCGSEDDPAYTAAIAALRRDPGAVGVIEQAYREGRAELRHALLLAAGAAGPAARPFLAQVAAAPVTKQGSTRGAIEESRIRLLALDGLERIALDGDEAAWRDLERLGTSGDRAVRIGAVAALKFGGQSEALDRLRAELPRDQAFLFDVRRPGVREVPQILDPRRHLKGSERTMDNRPHPDAGAPDPQERRRQRKGAPVAGGEKGNG